MIAINLLDSLRDFIQEQVKEYQYQMPDGRMLTPNIYSGYLPVRTDAAEEYAPFILVKLVKINDEQSESSADVKIIFVAYDDDTVDNWRSQINLMEHVRQALLKNKTIAKKFRLELPLSYEAAEYTPYPEGYGYLTTTYIIGQPQEEDFIHGYYGKEFC